MKRAKRLVALVMIASLTLGTASMAMAADKATGEVAATEETAKDAAKTEAKETDAAKKETTTEKAAADKEAAAKKAVADKEAAAKAAAAAKEAKMKEAAPAPVTYGNLATTEKHYYNGLYQDCGIYPVITGMDELNATILNDLFKDYSYFETKGEIASDTGHSTFQASYTVEDQNRYANVIVTYGYMDSSVAAHPVNVVKNYYVDKETKTAMTKEAYTAAVEAQAAAMVEATATEEAAEAAAAAEDTVMVPVRLHAEALGYTLSYDDATKALQITKGEFVTSITVGKNEYTVDGKRVALDAAPANQEGSLYVPVSFFEKVLGATVSVDKDGNVKITAAAKATATTAPAAEKAATTEPAADKAATTAPATK